MGTELELCEVFQINSLFAAKRRTEIMRNICIYGWNFKQKKGIEGQEQVVRKLA